LAKERQGPTHRRCCGAGREQGRAPGNNKELGRPGGKGCAAGFHPPRHSCWPRGVFQGPLRQFGRLKTRGKLEPAQFWAFGQGGFNPGWLGLGSFPMGRGKNLVAFQFQGLFFQTSPLWERNSGIGVPKNGGPFPRGGHLMGYGAKGGGLFFGPLAPQKGPPGFSGPPRKGKGREKRPILAQNSPRVSPGKPAPWSPFGTGVFGLGHTAVKFKSLWGRNGFLWELWNAGGKGVCFKHLGGPPKYFCSHQKSPN